MIRAASLFAAAAAAYKGNRQDDLLRGKGGIMNPVPQQIDGDSRLLHQSGINGTDGIGKTCIFLDVIESDPEADKYSVYIEEVSNETKALAEQLAEIIDEFLNDEEKLLSFVKANADDIEWD